MAAVSRQNTIRRDRLVDHYLRVRADSERLCEPLETEDHVVQTMPDVSPPKWHLAHTTWFFETFVLAEFVPGYSPFHEQYDHLFNSYYVTHGTPYHRPERGLLSRPTVREIRRYRARVDEAMSSLMREVSDTRRDAVSRRIVLGLNHEQQHQELLLTDIKHILYRNPLEVAYRPAQTTSGGSMPALAWRSYEGGLFDIGHEGSGFAFDNEGPRHRVHLDDFRLASRPVTNGEYLEFMQDGGYERAEHWLSDGWETRSREGWQAPLYWERRDGEWWYFTLEGMQRIDRHAPVCHVSHYEASAYASWAGRRLPTEPEWEVVASGASIEGNLRERGNLRPVASPDGKMCQLYGDVWEWTASPYTPYPGYKPVAGPIGEYNGKFMSSQIVLRGGSFATPREHIRPTYRNFFYPKDRWQFSGFRLADEA
jgi:ergothioneine biosynthesis protein EgtB